MYIYIYIYIYIYSAENFPGHERLGGSLAGRERRGGLLILALIVIPLTRPILTRLL